MRWLAISSVLFALVLAVAGCGGGDDEAASNTTTLTDTTIDDTTSDETTTVDTTSDETTTDETTGGDSGGLASGECRDLVEAGAELSQAFGAGTTTPDRDDVAALYEEVVDNAPEEIRSDLEVLANAWEQYSEVLDDVQIEAGETPDPDDLAKIQQAIASIDQQEVAAASQRINAWTTENCQSG
ncbi:MAG: hypothetical protein M3546_12590 [Actinomycetota bacterium]|nr:hypothetical protein [Actinomycetota bacterium]